MVYGTLSQVVECVTVINDVFFRSCIRQIPITTYNRKNRTHLLRKRGSFQNDSKTLYNNDNNNNNAKRTLSQNTLHKPVERVVVVVVVVFYYYLIETSIRYYYGWHNAQPVIPYSFGCLKVMIRSSVSFPRRGTRWLSTLTGVNTSSIVSSGRIRHPRQQQQRQHVPRSQRNASVVVMDPVSYMTTNAAATTTATATATMMTTANRKLNDVIFSSCRRRYHGDSHSSRNGSSSSSSSSSHQDPQSFYNETQKRIMQKTKELHASIMPLNERVRVREG